MSNENDFEEIVLGGGCFWCIEAVFNRVRGIKEICSGYAGGATLKPTYEEVCSGKTGHAEVVKIVFDPNEISLENILRIFFTVHDPTTINRQGSDVGTQYRSIILYRNENQKEITKKIIDEIIQEKVYDNQIVTEISPLSIFYTAEDYHQRYFEKNADAAYCQIMIRPKVAKFRNKYAGFYK